MFNRAKYEFKYNTYVYCLATEAYTKTLCLVGPTEIMWKYISEG